jgi:hypothetical protein
VKRTIFHALTACALGLACDTTHDAIVSERPSDTERSTIAQSLAPPAFPQSRIDEALIPFPLPAGEEAYASIDGREMYGYVVELAEISRRYRDNGHPKYWGRIIGSSADQETAEWLAGNFKRLGLSEVRIQPLDLPPQWMPQSYEATIASGGKTIKLSSAQPAYLANPLPEGGVELDAVYAGLGSEADFIGRDVAGKAVFLYEMLGLRDETAGEAIKRADAKGAAVVFVASMLPGNMRYQAYPSSTKAPAFVLGNDDGTAAREMIESAGGGKAPRVKVSLLVEKVRDLETSLVWGTLEGATDETIYLIAHKDGWFDGSGDNASGVASMLGLAEFYAKVPQADRRRTIVFLGLDGHHNLPEGNVGREWLTTNKAELFSKTALMINLEHPSTIQTQSRPRYYPGDEIAWANTYMPMQWYAGGKQRPELQQIAWNAFKKFGVPLLLDPSPTPPASDLMYFYRFVPGVDVSEYHHYFHTDWETPETVPWTGLEASTRAFAKIVDEVNRLPLEALQRPEDTSPPGRFGE